MPAALTPKKCKRLVHNGTERVECGTLYTGTDCPNKLTHVLKFASGFCQMGKHEGNKPRNLDGTPARTCKLFMSCGCKCHEQIDQMFKMAGMDRIFIENPEWKPNFIPFNPDDYVSSKDSFSSGGVDGPDDMERPPAGRVDTPARTLTERRTDTGRAARGGLEAQVFQQVRKLVDAGFGGDNLITPKILADMIREEYKIPTPSTGAINAVFERWNTLGFATTAKKPVRFVSFTGKGTWVELIQMKGRIKRERKMSQSAARRGFRS